MTIEMRNKHKKKGKKCFLLQAVTNHGYIGTIMGSRKIVNRIT